MKGDSGNGGTVIFDSVVWSRWTWTGIDGAKKEETTCWYIVVLLKGISDVSRDGEVVPCHPVCV